MTRTVVHYTDTTRFGGAERMLLNLLAAIDRRRWRPILFHHDPTGATPVVEGARALDVPTLHVPWSPGLRFIMDLPGLVRALHAQRPSVFHAHLVWPLRCSRALLAAHLAGVPAIVATQQLFSVARARGAARKQHFVSTVVDRYIAVSEEMAESMRPLCAGRTRHVTVIHNAVDPAPFAAALATGQHASRGPAHGRMVVLTLARLEPRKGLDHLVDAAAQVPEATFVVAGEGPERATLESRAFMRGVADRVHFVGHQANVPRLLADCDLFVLPSLFEGLPLSVVEAMAAGRPVVATNVGGTNEAVLHGVTGLLVPPADPDALGTAIRAVLGDAALRRRLGSAGGERARREFSSSVMAERVTTLYDELLGTRHANGVR